VFYSNGARPVHLIITMIKWIRTSRLSIKKTLSGQVGFRADMLAKDGKAEEVRQRVLSSRLELQVAVLECSRAVNKTVI